MAEERDLPLEEYHRAGLQITRGNPEVYKSLYSRRDDVTLANPSGPPVRGWSEVSAMLDRAAANYRDGDGYDSESLREDREQPYAGAASSVVGRSPPTSISQPAVSGSCGTKLKSRAPGSSTSSIPCVMPR